MPHPLKRSVDVRCLATAAAWSASRMPVQRHQPRWLPRASSTVPSTAQAQRRVAEVVEPEVLPERRRRTSARSRHIAAAAVAGLPGEVGAGDDRRVPEGLHLGEGQRRLAEPPVGRADAGVGVAPALVALAAIGRAAVADPAAVGPAVQPLEGGVGVRQQPLDQLGSEPPAPQLAEQHHEQRRGVDGAELGGPPPNASFRMIRPGSSSVRGSSTWPW